MSELIENADAGQHRQFQFLRSWGEYSRARSVRRLLWLTVSSIEKTADKLFKKYCSKVAACGSDLNEILAYCATKKVLNFYIKELEIITDMIQEYEAWLAAGNFLAAFLGDNRPYDELYDFRGE